MRIALFHNAPNGGAKRAIYEWSRRLVEKHTIDVYSLSTAEHHFLDIRPYVQDHNVYDFSPHQQFDSPWGRLNQLQRWRNLGEVNEIGQTIAGRIDASKYDVVFANTCLYTFAPSFLQFVQTPSVYYLHEPFGRQFSRKIQRRYFARNKWRESLDEIDPLIMLYHSRLKNIQKTSIAKVDLLLANSRFTREQMIRAFDVNSRVCHLGVDNQTFRPARKQEGEGFVLSVGELTPRKGFDFIVTSIGQIAPDQRPALKLACNMIDPKEKGYVQDLAYKSGVDLEILEKLDSEALAVQYSRAALCVYAPVMEPLGLVPLEAMACGTPVVGVAEGGVLETVVDGVNGLLVDRTAEYFAAAVVELLEKPELRQQLGQQGRRYVLENWTWERSAAELEHHLHETANNRFCDKVENYPQGKQDA